MTQARHACCFAALLILLGGCSLFRERGPSRPSGGTGEPDAPRAAGTDAIARSAFDKVNSYRSSRGLPALRWDSRISAECESHSQDMAGRRRISHDGFSERTARLRQKMNMGGAAENVASNSGYNDPAEVAVQGWIRSSGHQRNMVGAYTHAGMGVARDASGGYYFTQVFVAAR
jgi:uncharacterized protein YkwD